jgi:hypothetical protein
MHATLSERSTERVRGSDEQTNALFSYVSPEARVPHDHPLRTIRLMTDAVSKTLSPRFARLYSAPRMWMVTWGAPPGMADQ